MLGIEKHRLLKQEQSWRGLVVEISSGGWKIKGDKEVFFHKTLSLFQLRALVFKDSLISDLR